MRDREVIEEDGKRVAIGAGLGAITGLGAIMVALTKDNAIEAIKLNNAAKERVKEAIKMRNMIHRDYVGTQIRNTSLRDDLNRLLYLSNSRHLSNEYFKAAKNLYKQVKTTPLGAIKGGARAALRDMRIQPALPILGLGAGTILGTLAGSLPEREAYYKEGIEKLALNARAKRLKPLLEEAYSQALSASEQVESKTQALKFMRDSGIKTMFPGEARKVLEGIKGKYKGSIGDNTVSYRHLMGRINHPSVTSIERRKRYITSGRKAQDIALGAPARAKELEDFKALESSIGAKRQALRQEQSRKDRNLKLGIGAGAGALVGAGVYTGTRNSGKKKKIAHYKEGIEKLARS